MAKAKNVFPSHRYFLIIGVILSICALGIFVAASQKQTNTLSDASGCNKPKLELSKTDNTGNIVRYHLRLRDNCPGENDYIIDVLETPTEPYKYDTWYWWFGNQNEYKPLIKKIDEGSIIYFSASRPTSTYQKSEIWPGTYKYFTIEAKLSKNRKIKDRINLIYVIEN